MGAKYEMISLIFGKMIKVFQKRLGQSIGTSKWISVRSRDSKRRGPIVDAAYTLPFA